MDKTKNCSVEETDLFGLNELVKGKDPVVDIIAVHGLDGGSYSTFQHKNGTMWLKDLLPEFIPNARIYTYGYDASTHSTHPISCQYIYDHATDFLAKVVLERERTKTEKRPIIFVVHSLGGILVKSALSQSDLGRPGIHEDQKSLSLSTYGILFFGTPHLGGNLVDAGQIILNIASIFVYTNTKLLRDISMFSRFLQQQLSEYSYISGRYDTVFFYETLKDPRVGKIIVPIISARVPGATNAREIGMAKDHVNLVKFPDVLDRDFETVKTVLELMVEKAHAGIAPRWKLWEKEKNLENINYSLPTLIVPFVQNPKFVGRDDLLLYVHQSLTAEIEHKQRVFVISGMGGIGKTQIALEYAYRYKYAYSAIHWIDATSKDTVEASFWQMAQRYRKQLTPEFGPEEVSRKLGLPEVSIQEEKDKPAEKLQQTVDAMMNLLAVSDNDWLLIFDGYDYIQAFDLTKYFPPNTQGRILVTSRRPDCQALALDSKQVGELSIPEAVELLLKNINIDSVEENGMAELVAIELGCLPLALAQANTYIYQRGMKLGVYLEQYRHCFKSVMQVKPRVGWTHNETVLTTWEVSFDHISKERPQAATLLLMCSYFSYQDIPEELLRNGVENTSASDIDNVAEELELLVSYALMRKTTSDEPSYWIHPVVHKWARERQDGSSAGPIAEQALALFARALFFDDDARNVTQWSRERKLKQQIYAFLENTRKYRSVWFSSPQNLDRFHWIPAVLGEQGDYQRAIELQREVLAADLVTFGEKDERTAEVINRLGVFLYYEGMYEKSEESLLKAFDLRKEILGGDDRKTLQSWGNVLEARMEQGWDKLELVVAQQRELLERRIKLFGDTDLATLESYHNLGCALLNLRKESEAEPILRKATVGRQRILGPEHPYTLLSQSQLRTTLNRLGKFPNTLKEKAKTVETATRILGQNHPYSIGMMEDLASLYDDQKHYSEAVAIYRDILKISQRRIGEEDPQVLDTILNLDRLYPDAKKCCEAGDTNEELPKILQRVSREEIRSTISTMNSLGMVLEEIHEIEESEQLLRNGLILAKNLSEPDENVILAIMNNLANALRYKGSYTESAELNQKVLAKLKETRGSKDPWILKSLSNSGQTLLLEGQIREALPLLLQSVEGQEIVFGEDSEDTVKVKHLLVLAEASLERLERKEEAEGKQKAHALKGSSHGIVEKLSHPLRFKKKN